MGAKIGCGSPPKVVFTRRATKSIFKMTLSLKQAIRDIKLKKSFDINFRLPSVTIPISGTTKRPIKMLLARMASTYKKQSYQLTGKHPSPRSASV